MHQIYAGHKNESIPTVGYILQILLIRKYVTRTLNKYFDNGICCVAISKK